jgi:hypothetical protein
LCSLLPFTAASAAHAQLKQLVPADHPARTADFSLSRQAWTNDPPPLAGGMLTSDEIGPNTLVGVGLVKMRARKRDGSDLRTGAPAAQTRNPAVTFVLKF